MAAADSLPQADVPGLPELGGLPLIGILRGCPPAHCYGVVAAAAEAGIRVVEITMDSESPLRQIEVLSRVEGLVVGVGSVLRPAEVRSAVSTGARFVVCPVVDVDVLKTCMDLGVPCLPGAATPTEIFTATRSGAAAVKVFPARQLGGPEFIRAVASPLRRPRLVPTGGVSPEDAADYLAAGAVAVAAGSDLFPTAALATGDYSAVEARARRWVEALG